MTRILTEEEYLQLYNPWHDRLGRFTFRRGAGAPQVSGGAREWLNKPVATIGGKTVTRKHVAITAGAIAAAAAATGAVILLRKGNAPVTIIGERPISGVVKSKEPIRTNVIKEQIGQRRELIDGAQEPLDKFDPEREAAYDEPRKQIFYASYEDSSKVMSGGAAAICDDLGNTHYGPESILLTDDGDLQALIIHEELHARTRVGYGMKSLARGGAPPLYKGAQDFGPHNSWLEEGLGESLTAALAKESAIGDIGYPDEVAVVTYGVRRAVSGTGKDWQPEVCFDVLSDLHKYNGSDKSVTNYMIDFPNIAKSRGYNVAQPFALRDLFMASGTRNLRSLSRIFKYMEQTEPHKWTYFEHDDQLEEWLGQLREFAIGAYLLADVPTKKSKYREIIERSEREVMDKYGTIYVPHKVILKNLKKLEDEQKRSEKAVS